MWLDSELSFKPHIDSVVHKVNYSTSVLARAKHCFTFSTRKKLATQLILPILDYTDVVYMNASKLNLSTLDTAYNKICRFILDCPFTTHHCSMYDSLSWPSLEIRRQLHWFQLLHKCIHPDYPIYLKQHLVQYSSHYKIRHCAQFYFTISPTSKAIGKRAFKFRAPSQWNKLPPHVRSLASPQKFKTSLSSYLETNCTCFG